jgi:hypothetical protein
LSVTEFGELGGVVVYWLQLPGGLVFVNKPEGYAVHEFTGPPSEFIANASTGLGQKVQIWFGEKPIGPPQSIAVLRDRNGVASVAIVNDGSALSFSVLNVTSPFDTRAALDLAPNDPSVLAKALEGDQVRLALDVDRRNATLNLYVNNKPATEIALNVHQLEALIAQLAEARARLDEPVASQPPLPESGRPLRYVMVLDPAWRTELPVHPTLNGVTLRLRHPGFGWLTFLLPWHETKKLGEWLAAAKPPEN